MNYFLWELYVATSSTCLLNHFVSVSFCNLLQIELPYSFISFSGYNSLFVTTIKPTTFQLVTQYLNQLRHCTGCTTFHYKIMTLCDTDNDNELFRKCGLNLMKPFMGRCNRHLHSLWWLLSAESRCIISRTQIPW